MIKCFKIKEYRQFESAKFDNFSNINLFIGENDTGKTTILKFLYANCSELREIVDNGEKDISVYSSLDKYKSKIKIHFGNSSNVSMNFAQTETAIVGLNHAKTIRLGLNYANEYDFDFTISNSKNEIITSKENVNDFNYDYKALFIPAKEILSIMNSIAYLKSKGISDFDDSYNDIVFEILTKKNVDEANFLEVFKNKSKYDFYNGKVKMLNNGNKKVVYYRNDGEVYDINFVAEGIKKLGIFPILHNTGNLTKKTVLFIDEPENSLHPKLVREFMRFLVDISKDEIQIFMASHNSFVLNQLSNIAEIDNYPINVYFFLKDKENINKVNTEGPFDLSKEFPDNSITDEAYSMFKESVNVSK